MKNSLNRVGARSLGPRTRQFPCDYNTARDFVNRNVEQGRALKTAFINDERELTYGALQKHTLAFANAFKRHRVEREQRLALIMLDTVVKISTLCGP